MLHLTNGDVAAEAVRRTGIPGEVIAWRDVLHEGPVPAGLALEAMSDARARFIAGCQWGSFTETLRQFGARDAALRAARDVVLWFEHDLYDQLQLIQILATLAEQPETRAELICIDSFAGVVPFHGLGQLKPTQIATLWPHRKPVTQAQRALALRAWKAFSSPDPLAVRQLLAGDISALPFLRAALGRLLEEYPSEPHGLSRTERQILTAVEAGHWQFSAVFEANQRAENAPFMGDAAFQLHVNDLTFCRVPLLTREPIELTDAGRSVLAGDSDHRQLNGVDRWIGGVHLTH